MPAQFIDTPRFPDTVSIGAGGGPVFQTDVFTGYSGIEQRAVKMRRPRHKYKVALGTRVDADMTVARDFFFTVGGKNTGFRFKDWSDYRIVDGTIGTGNGVLTVFNIIKTYAAGSLTFDRRIYKPVGSSLTLKDNGTLKVEDTDFFVNYSTGVITFAVAPVNTHVLTVTCDFDVPVRLDVDQMTSAHTGYTIQEWQSIGLIEVFHTEAEFEAAALTLDFGLIANSQFIPVIL